MFKHKHYRKNPLGHSGSGACAQKAIHVGFESLEVIFVGKNDLGKVVP